MNQISQIFLEGESLTLTYDDKISLFDLVDVKIIVDVSYSYFEIVSLQSMSILMDFFNQKCQNTCSKNNRIFRTVPYIYNKTCFSLPQMFYKVLNMPLNNQKFLFTKRNSR